MKPILSIVIVNYNYGRFLEDAIKSVLDQATDEVELIIIDGGSTDNSVEIIRKYAGDLPPNTSLATNHSALTTKLAYWVSEPDKGQSDAFNKGFARANGKYLTWLNADDIMPKGAISAIVKQLKAHSDCEWFTGNFCRFTEDGSIIECAWGPNYLPYCLQSKGQPLAVYGPATIFTKELFDRVGGMKVYENFMMDTDLWMRFIVAGVKQRRINHFCWAFRMHADSKTAEFGDHKLSPEQRAKFEAERARATQETGYKPSTINRKLILLWRVFDGSFVKSILLKRFFKKMEVV